MIAASLKLQATSHEPRATGLHRLRARVLDAVVPVSWDGLSPEQFVRMVRVLRSTKRLPELQVRMAWVLLGVTWRKPRMLAAIYIGMTAEERHKLAVLTSAPFFLQRKMTRTLLPEIHAGRQKLAACHTDLLNEVDAYTWGLADTCFMKYNTSRHMDLLRAMALVLYAPMGMDRTARLRGEHMGLQLLLDENELLALHANWSGMRAVLQDEAPWVFRPVNQKKVLAKLRGWTDVLRSMSGGKFGPYPETCTTPARIFLKELSDQIELAKRKKEEAERLAKKARR